MDLTPEEIRYLNERLDREWDVDRRLQLLVSGGVVLGLLLGRLHDRRWRGLSLLVAGWGLCDALSGWSPPRWLMRRLGVRTRADIERERYVTLFGQEPPSSNRETKTRT